MGQSKEYVGQFSSSLSKSAADYAAYMGASSAEEISAIGKKFAKATLGEVGELKDLGINIDVTSLKFQQLVKDIQATTGASEAQAKQMAIAKDIIKQVEYTSGSASAGMLDGWQQLNKLLDNFKEILGQVGGVFSKVFGPVLSAFNTILEIPFVKSVTAWSIALGSVIAGYIGIVTLLKKNLDATKKIADSQDKILAAKEALNKFEKDGMKLAKNRLKNQEKIAQAYQKQAEAFAKLQAEGLNTNFQSKEWKEMLKKLKNQNYDEFLRIDQLKKDYKNPASTATQTRQKKIQPLDQMIREVQGSFENLTSKGAEAALKMAGLNTQTIEYIRSLNLSTLATKKSTLAIIKQTAAKIKSATINYAAKLASTGADATTIGASLTALLVSLWAKLKHGFVVFFGQIKGFFVALKPFFAALGKILMAVVKPLLVVFGWIVAAIGVFVIVFDAVTMAINKLRGIQTTKGTITRWFAELIYSTDTSEMDRILAERKARYENAKREFNSIIKDYLKGLQTERFNRMIQNMLPQNAIVALKKRNTQLQAEHKRYRDLLEQQRIELQKAYIIDDEKDRNAAVETVKQKIKDTLSALTDNYNAQIEVVDKLTAKNNELVQSMIAYVNKVDQIRKKYRGVFETFNYGYRNGKFGNYTDEQRYNNMNLRSMELQRRLQSGNFRNLEQQENMTKELFDLTKQMYQYQLQSMMKQREAAIQNLKGMNELIKQAYTFKSTAQSAISADSTEAIVLQSRQRDTIDKKEFGPIIEQQKQIKEIERKMLQRQTTGTNILNSIGQQLLKIANRMPGNTSTGPGIIVVAP